MKYIVLCLSMLLPAYETAARMRFVGSNAAKIKGMCSHKGTRTYLLSYPRSGNTWMRYCLEFLTERPSFSRIGSGQQIQQPLAWSAHFAIDEHKQPIEKIHRPAEIRAQQPGDKLIFLLRNPKETIARYERTTFAELLQDYHVGRNHRASIYFDVLACYDAWPADDRLLIYYEDFLDDPQQTLKHVLAFLGESDARLATLMEQYDEHKACCIQLYKVADSRGEDTLYHSKKLSRAYRQQVDQWIAEEYPELWEKYLVRYAE